jgi:hypothetical protein
VGERIIGVEIGRSELERLHRRARCNEDPTSKLSDLMQFTVHPVQTISFRLPSCDARPINLDRRPVLDLSEGQRRFAEEHCAKCLDDGRIELSARVLSEVCNGLLRRLGLSIWPICRHRLKRVADEDYPG